MSRNILAFACALATLANFTPISLSQPQGERKNSDARRDAIAELTKGAENYAKMVATEKDWGAKLKKKKDAKLSEMLTDLRADIKRMKADKPADFAQQLTFTRAGEAGAFPFSRVRVDTVIDRMSAMVLTKTNKDGFERDDDVAVLVVGVDTSKWVDDLAIDAPAGVWLVDTVKRGGRTVFRLTRLELTKAESDAIMKAAKPR